MLLGCLAGFGGRILVVFVSLRGTALYGWVFSVGL